MTGAPRLNVFFSHSSRDAEWVERVGAQAKAAGVDVYLAEHDVQPGQHLGDKVKAAIERCDAVIALLSKNSLQSVYVQQEIGIAHRADKLVIPILMEDVASQDLGILNGVEYIRLEPSTPHEGLGRLSAALAQLIDERRRELEERLAAQRAETERRRGQELALQQQRERELQLAEEARRRHSQDMLAAGAVLLVVGLIIISQAG
jgi:hypothetical protein